MIITNIIPVENCQFRQSFIGNLSPIKHENPNRLNFVFFCSIAKLDSKINYFILQWVTNKNWQFLVKTMLILYDLAANPILGGVCWLFFNQNQADADNKKDIFT